MKISVIIPTFKPQDYVFQCLDSLCAQTFPKDDFEVIVVLNGCGQPYEERLKGYFVAHSEMNWIFTQTDVPGVSNARNMALDLARGEYVAFIDDDDYVSPRYLERLYEISGADTVALSYLYAFEDGNPQVQMASRFTDTYNEHIHSGVLEAGKIRRYFSGPCMKLVPMPAIGNRRYDTRFRNGEDSIFMFLISDRIKWCRFAPDDAIYYVRYRKGSAITREGDFRSVLSNRLKMCLEYSKIYWRSPEKYKLRQYVYAVLGSFHVIAIKAGGFLRRSCRRPLPVSDVSGKKIVIIANFTSTLYESPDGRFIYLAKMLCKRGYDVEMIVSDFAHRLKSHREESPNPYEFRLTVIHEPGYSGNVSLKRLWSHYAWGRNVGKHLRSLSERPDIIYSAVPSLTAARKAAAYCRSCGNSRPRLVIDIQDLWPEAFMVVVKNPVLRGMFYPMKKYADYAYRSADVIIGVSDTYRDRGLSVNAAASGLTIYLGNDGQMFDKAREDFAETRTGDEFRLGYVGTMGYSYDLECAIDAVRIVMERGRMKRKVVFVAMGGGPLLERYGRYADDAGIESVFTGPLPYDRMVGMLCSCDAVINCLRKGAAQSVTNKVGDYALAGKPVINTQENIEYRTLLESSGCGINCACGNAEEVADAIERLASDENECREMGARSRSLGLDRFDRRRTYPLIVEKIEKEFE